MGWPAGLQEQQGQQAQRQQAQRVQRQLLRGSRGSWLHLATHSCKEHAMAWLAGGWSAAHTWHHAWSMTVRGPRDQPLSRVTDDRRAWRYVAFMLGRPGPRLFLLAFELRGSLCVDAWDPRACALPGRALRRFTVAASAARSVQRQSARSAHFLSPASEASFSRHQQRAVAWTRIWPRLSNGCRKPW